LKVSDENSRIGSASGSISQSHGSADPDPDPDPHENVMDPQHWFVQRSVRRTSSQKRRKTTSNPFHAPSLTGRLSGGVLSHHVEEMSCFKCEIYVTHLLIYYFRLFIKNNIEKTNFDSGRMRIFCCGILFNLPDWNYSIAFIYCYAYNSCLFRYSYFFRIRIFSSTGKFFCDMLNAALKAATC
jgi:hypothetical protein